MKKEYRSGKISMGPGEILMWTAGILFCLVLISVFLMGGLFARYASGNTGRDGARVISFGNITITETGDFVRNTNTMAIAPGADIEKKAVVHFPGSEAATYVFLEIIHSDNWDGENGVFSNAGMLSWQIAEGWMPLEENVYYRALVPNEALSADIIKDGVIKVSTGITHGQIDELACTVAFRASVVQSHGFDSVGAAWASLRSKGGT